MNFVPFTVADAWITLVGIATYWTIFVYLWRKERELPITALIKAAGFFILFVVILAAVVVMGGLVNHSIKTIIA